MVNSILTRLNSALDRAIDLKMTEDDSVDYSNAFTEALINAGCLYEVYKIKDKYLALPEMDSIKLIPDLSKMFQKKIEQIEKMNIDNDRKERIIELLLKLRNVIGFDKIAKKMSKNGQGQVQFKKLDPASKKSH